MLAPSAALGLVMLVASASPEAPRDNPFLAEAKALYEEFEFERCLKRLEQAAQWKSTPEELVEIELYGGLCAYSQGLERDAQDHFRVALRLDPEVQLPPYTSPKIVELFRKVAAELPPPSPPALTEEPHPAAQGLTDEGPAPAPRSWLLPGVLGGASLAAAGAGAVFGLQARALEAQARTARFSSDSALLGDRSRASAQTANLLFGVAGAAAVGAVVSYFLSGAR